MGQPAARVADPVAHPLPPTLTPGPGSLNVLIGGKPAWRGVPAASAAVLQSAKQASDAIIKTAMAATAAAVGPAYPAAKAAEEATKAAMAGVMGSLISSMANAGSAAGAAAGGVGAMVDIHTCTTPLPIPPHGPGVVIDGSTSVLINGLPACFMGNTVLEALGPPNKITRGCPTVLIGSGPAVSVSVDTSVLNAQMEDQARKAAAEAAKKAEEEQKQKK